MKSLTITLSPEHELQSDITKHLDPEERWIWFGLRMLAHLSGTYPCVGRNTSLRLNDRFISRELKVSVEDWIIGKYELIKMEAISVDEIGRITVYEGRDKGDRIKQGIIREADNHIKELIGKPIVGSKPIRERMMARIYEGATIEDFKAVIDRAAGMATKEQRKDINFVSLFCRKNFWDWVVKSRNVA